MKKEEEGRRRRGICTWHSNWERPSPALVVVVWAFLLLFSLLSRVTLFFSFFFSFLRLVIYFLLVSFSARDSGITSMTYPKERKITHTTRRGMFFIDFQLFFLDFFGCSRIVDDDSTHSCASCVSLPNDHAAPSVSTRLPHTI